MNWELKTEMAKYLNNEDYTEATKIVFNNLDTLDEQGFDMFLSGLEIIKQNLEKDKEMHIAINNKTTEWQTESMRTAMRMALYEKLVSEL